MLQQSQIGSRQKPSTVIDKLKKLVQDCQNIKTQINSIKNATFKAKRKIDLDMKYVRDTLRNSMKSKRKIIHQGLCGQEDKENNMRVANIGDQLGQIQVKLNEKKMNVVKEQKKDLKLCEKILLELQQIKLLEQRGNLISKKNLRMANYYSQNKTRLDGRRSQTQQSQP